MSDKTDGRDVLEKMVEEFERNVKEDKKLQDKVKDFDRKIVINYKDGSIYNLELKDGDMGDIHEGDIDDSDITITTDPETLNDLLDGNIGAMEAYSKKKIKIDASLTDMLKIKDIL